MISKTKVNERLKRKKHSEIVETIEAAKKNKAWIGVAQIISSSRKRYSSINLKRIEKETKEGDTIVVPGKVLGSGNIKKRIRVCAINFSDSAREKLKEEKGEIVTILEEIRKNPRMEGIKILR